MRSLSISLMKIPIISLFLLSVIIIFIGCRGEHDSEKATQITSDIHEPEVTTLPLTTTTIDDWYEVTGNVASPTRAVIASKVTGYISAIHVREGDQIMKNQVVLEIDDRDSQAALDKARAGQAQVDDGLKAIEQDINAVKAGQKALLAQKELQTATLARYEQLFTRGSVSAQEFEEIQAKQKVATAQWEQSNDNIAGLLARQKQMVSQRQQAEADVTLAQTQINYTRLTAPFAGIVVRKLVEIGELAVQGKPLIEIEDNTRYRLEVMVAEYHVGLLKVGQKVPVQIASIGDLELTAVIARIEPSLEPESHTTRVKLDLPAVSVATDPGAALRSGLFGRARFRVGAREVLLVPGSALLHHGQLSLALVVDANNIAHRRLVTLGPRHNDSIEILSGLDPGDVLVIEGMDQLEDGMHVRLKH